MNGEFYSSYLYLESHRIPATSGIFFRNELISFISNHLMFLLSINHVQDFFQSAVPFLAALVGIIVFALFLHFLG